MTIVVAKRPLTSKWLARAQSLLAAGDKERHFNALGRLPDGARSLFAFEGPDSNPDDAVGILVYAVRPVKGRRILHIDYVFVLNGHRGNGIGSKLLSAAYEVAVERQCLDVELDVRPFNYPMLRVVEKAGYIADQPRRMWKPVVESHKPEGEFF